jgi:hypothetical protein
MIPSGDDLFECTRTGAKERNMATPKDLIINQLGSGAYLFEKFTSDLSDVEYFRPPVAGANHAAWILGHVACSEDWMTSPLAGVAPRIPEATRTLFKGGSKCLADASLYPSRREIDELFRNTRAHTIEALKAFDPARFDHPAPEGLPKELFPTLGAVWALQGTHQFWHIGQLSVCRAALKKPHVLM